MLVHCIHLIPFNPTSHVPARGWSCISAGCSIQARKVIQLSRLPTQVLWTGKDPDVIHQSRQDKTILMTEKTMRIFICLPLLLQSWERLRIGIPTCSWRNFPVVRAHVVYLPLPAYWPITGRMYSPQYNRDSEERSSSVHHFVRRLFKSVGI